MRKSDNKAIFSALLITIVCICIFYVILRYVSSYVGWEGYRKWEYRIGTTDIKDSKRRNVFVKELNFKVENYNGKIEGFNFYTEKGFRYGRNSDQETVLLSNSQYPYQLSFGYERGKQFGVLLRSDQMSKFDSSNLTQGFLKTPNLSDTIVVDIVGLNIHSGIIKIWQ